jgi:hypothetical protein
MVERQDLSVVSKADNIQPNPNLMSNYLFNKKGDKITVTLQNLAPGRAYNLYLYTASSDGGKATRAATLTVNGTALSATGDPQNSFVLGSNYLKLTVPADSDGKIQIIETPSPESTGGREADLNGFQIAAVQ